jgi:hypothetical protein
LPSFPPHYSSEFIHMQIGSVQKVDEGSDALGILSCLNISAHSKRPSIQAISSMLLQRCPKEKKSQVQSLLTSSTTALIVSSRILNVPLHICPPAPVAPVRIESICRCLMLSRCLYGKASWRKFPSPKR